MTLAAGTERERGHVTTTSTSPSGNAAYRAGGRTGRTRGRIVSAHREPGRVSLLADILRGVPSLDGALCQNRHMLFDPPTQGEQLGDPRVQDRHNIALSLCQSCLCLTQCARRGLTATGSADGGLYGLGSCNARPYSVD